LFQLRLNGLHNPAPRSANGKRGWDNGQALQGCITPGVISLGVSPLA